MNVFLTSIVVGGVLFCGCGKKVEVPKPAVSRAPTPKSSNAVEFAAPPPPPLTPSAVEPTAGTELPVNSKIDLEFLNDTLRDFVKQENRFPRSLEEFIKTKRATRLPKAPPGKKYVLDTNRKMVVMVNE